MDALRVAKVEQVILERRAPTEPFASVKAGGTLHLTPHHLFFSPDSPDTPHTLDAAEKQQDADDNDTSTPEDVDEVAASEVWIPYPTINLLRRLPQIDGLFPLTVGTKTFDSYTLYFRKDRHGGAEDVWQSVRDCAVAQSVEQLYAFYYQLPHASPAVSSSRALPINNPTVSSAPPLLGSSPDQHTTLLGAHAHSLAPDTITDAAPALRGWATFSPRTEFARQGVGSRTKAWRFTDINRDYTFSPTYPSKLVVPARISDSVLSYAAKYRSKARIPALTYLHWANHASITRSSQPMVGLKNARSAQDERLVECIFTSHLSPDTAYASTSFSQSASSSAQNLTAHPSAPAPHIYGATSTNIIVDARPTTNAMANVAKGAGTENMEWYKWGKKAYLGIDNIHVMRNSLRTVVEVIAEADAGHVPVDHDRLARSGWLRHLSAILDGALLIVRNIHINSSHVLIHCSDGWDRTSQLSATAQICLDPYYRTIDGFKVLVEKDWLAFGHMFLQRSGHLSSTKLFTATPDNFDADDDATDDGDFGQAVKGAQAFFASVTKQFASSSHLKEISPVFHQFLDCVRQIQRQFPERFEFNEDFLLDMHYHLYACQFGTFLFDSERQRRVAASSSGKPFVDRTVSIWEWVDLPEQRRRYVNEEYNSELDDRDSREHDADGGVLLVNPKDVKFWHRLFKRSEDDMSTSRFLQVQTQTSTTSDAGSESVADPLAGSSGSLLSVGDVGTPASSRGPSPAPVPKYAVRQRTISAPRGQTATPPPALPSTSSPVPASASAFSRFSSRLPTSVSSPHGWNWSQLGSSVSTGALSAFNTIRSSATDAIGQLRDPSADEMWGNTAYAPGTGIGEGRHPPSRQASGTVPRTRLPSDTNPWSTSPDMSAAANGSGPSLGPGSLGGGGTTLPTRRSSVGWTSISHNPWDAPGAPAAEGAIGLGKSAELAHAAPSPVAPSLDQLTLEDVRSEAPAPTAKPVANEDHRKWETAALGGDSKAWDPLGAL